MRAIVTGACGFIGSHVAELFLERGWPVQGWDCFTENYARADKDRNLAILRGPTFAMRAEPISWERFPEDLRATDVVVHLAGEPGVINSWGPGFDLYMERNIRATQIVLESCVQQGVARVVVASSASVYGDAGRSDALHEASPLQPLNPYGVSKLAVEALCRAYAARFDLSIVALRYFTVYGPRQRPDMAVSRVISRVLGGAAPVVFGDGSQVRDFTYVGDIAGATVAAATVPQAERFSVMNVCCGEPHSVRDVVERVCALFGRPNATVELPPRAGEVIRSVGDHTQARARLAWSPTVSLEDGLSRQVAWARAASDDQSLSSAA